MVRVKDSSWWNRGKHSNIKHNYLNSINSSYNTVPHSTSPALTSTPLSPMPTY